MAAFSYQHHNFLLDPVFLSNTRNISENMSAFSEEPNTTSNTCFSQFYPVDFNESSSLENVTNEPSVTNKHSADSSLSVDDDKPESGQQVTQKVIITMDKKRKNRDSSVQSKVGPREVKGKNQKKSCGVVKDGEEKKTKACKIDKKKGAEEKAPTGYIHVRARRGQATDSHSLAERVRREKISERMKLLQALVPGCDKVTGKALMLDEIINYVQSLQNQVEFLSTRLASMNPMLYDFGMDIDSFMVPPEILTGLASPLLPLNVQQSNLVQATAAFSDTTTNFNTPNSYALVDSTTSPLFQQGQNPNILLQDNGQLLWGVDDQRQKLINQSGFSNNNSCSFH